MYTCCPEQILGGAAVGETDPQITAAGGGGRLGARGEALGDHAPGSSHSAFALKPGLFQTGAQQAGGHKLPQSPLKVARQREKHGISSVTNDPVVFSAANPVERKPGDGNLGQVDHMVGDEILEGRWPLAGVPQRTATVILNDGDAV